MLHETFFTLAAFTAPEQIGLNPLSMLWLLPLVAAIAVVYKALKVPKVNFRAFTKEAALPVR
jgi:putative effector of murein hydrolase